MTDRVVIKSSHMLYEFYKDWYSTVATGEGMYLDSYNIKAYGLCSNLAVYVDELNFRSNSPFVNSAPVKREMKKQFIEAGLDDLYPFGQSNYELCMMRNKMHRDPKRLQWVKDRIEDGVIEDENTKPSVIRSSEELAKDS